MVLYIKMFLHLWYYLAEFLSEWQIFQTKAVEKIEKHILCLVLFLNENPCRLWGNVENVVDPEMHDACALHAG